MITTPHIRTQRGSVLVTLIKWLQGGDGEALVFVESSGFYAIVVYADALVWVPDGHVEGEVVVEGVGGGGEVELSEGSVGDMKLHLVGAEDEPEDEDGNAYDGDDGDDDLEEEVEDTATEAATAAIAAIAAGAVVGFPGIQRSSVLVTLIKWLQGGDGEALVFVESSGFYAIVVYADALVWVPDGHVEGEVVVEGVGGGGEIELSEGSVGDMKLHLVGAEDEPEDEDGDAYDDDDGEDDLEDEVEDTATEAATAAIAAIAAGAVLVLNAVTDNDTGGWITKRYIRRTSNVHTVPARYEAPNFPSHPSIELDQQQHGPVGLVLAEGDAVVRSHRHVRPVDERRPDVDVFVTFVSGWNGGHVCDLLAVVGGEDVEFIVVNPDVIVRVSGGDGDLEVGGEEVGGGDVEGVDGGILEDELWLFGLQNGPNDENDEEEDEVEDEKSSAYFFDELLPPALVVAALFCRHVSGGGRRWMGVFLLEGWRALWRDTG
ncbi:hypothetical protein F0562_017088 [Nyssa sinensis]|uniref:Uncharacterized protein n=1 Tax=Nyssa sinensis TaxID=561372 RepID=A0A5J4ZGS4_9ASTE|nr:hypothetical protein F0562_017088 [Nyssa sinensis]